MGLSQSGRSFWHGQTLGVRKPMGGPRPLACPRWQPRPARVDCGVAAGLGNAEGIRGAVVLAPRRSQSLQAGGGGRGLRACTEPAQPLPARHPSPSAAAGPGPDKVAQAGVGGSPVLAPPHPFSRLPHAARVCRSWWTPPPSRLRSHWTSLSWTLTLWTWRSTRCSVGRCAVCVCVRVCARVRVRMCMLMCARLP